MRNFYTILSIVFVVLSCKTLDVKSLNQSTADSKLLGSVGEAKTFLLERDYSSLAIPDYKEGVKLDVQVKSFNKSSFKNFKKTQSVATTKVSINYIDSLEVKPTYLELLYHTAALYYL